MYPGLSPERFHFYSAPSTWPNAAFCWRNSAFCSSCRNMKLQPSVRQQHTAKYTMMERGFSHGWGWGWLPGRFCSAGNTTTAYKIRSCKSSKTFWFHTNEPLKSKPWQQKKTKNSHFLINMLDLDRILVSASTPTTIKILSKYKS